ncbi:ABC transporter substrate-binding protein [Flexivirga endophytica]|uniref:ABC transporter substrate-binding protein n=1 Tax=Flexivirga endophytica TaxID=1849103 RepID=A0A916WUZ8_9MICO|nr:ABC transporter substrate-binding protein [Flexivirga endophytica]GGB32858.1 ABC transporter substrate-binding protein [Flexivirga endophytica]GHB40853.1 ABC transporter substrate-binding protein [Flexivirga endophytica]
MRWTKLAALSAAGVTAVSLAACSSGGPSGSGGSGSGNGNGNNTAAAKQSEAAVAATNPDLKAPAPEVKGAKKGGTLYIDDHSNPPTMDPAGIYYVDSNAFATQYMYRTLTQFQIVKGKPVLVPDMAEGVGKQSADGLTWTFKIRKGLKYSDGSPVKIEDFVYGLKRSFAKESVALNGTDYQRQFLVGGKDYKGPYKQPNADFKGVTTKGDDTLVFHLVKKLPSFNYFASFPEFTPVPKAKDTKGDYQKHPLTTGPYKVDSYNIGSKLTLSRNTNWDPKTDPVRHAYPDKVQINLAITDLGSQQRILANSGTGTNTVNIGEIDASLESKVTGAQKDQFALGPSSCEYYVNLDVNKIPLEVRKAVGYAYPFNQIRKAAGLSKLNYQPATTYAAPSLQGYKKYDPLPYATGQGNGDPAKAKAILKKAGKVGFELKYYYTGDDPSAVAANTAKKNGLIKAGFKVKDIPVPKAERTKKIADPKAPVNMSQGTPGWCYDWPTGDSVYPVLFSGEGIPDGTTVGQFKNATVNAEMDKISKMDPEKAAPEWAKLDQEIMTKYVPGLPDYYSMNTATFGKNVQNVTLNPIISMPNLSQLWVKQ